MLSQSELLQELRWRPLTRVLIMRVKVRSLRQGQWFRVLKAQERGLLDAVASWVNTIRSRRLEEILTHILTKLTGALASSLMVLRERGRYMAYRASQLAVGWGNNSAWIWRFDNSFGLSLGVGVLV